MLCFLKKRLLLPGIDIPVPVGTGEDQPSQHLSGFVDDAQESLRCGGCGTHSSHCGRTTQREKDVGGTVLVFRALSGAT